jgi:hypothetical protein
VPRGGFQAAHAGDTKGHNPTFGELTWLRALEKRHYSCAGCEDCAKTISSIRFEFFLNYVGWREPIYIACLRAQR